MALLEIKSLRKEFRRPDGSGRLVVSISEFVLAERAQVALSGDSGCGKTTFLNLISGILRPDQGSIRLAGADIAQLNEADRDRFRARNIGYIFQTFNLLQGYTCLENVLLGMYFGGSSDRAFARQLLERVGLGKSLDYYPRQLSTGQQQRVAVARAMANRPKLVLADEPTGNLDSKNAVEALKLIRETCRELGAALLLVSHDQHVLGQFEIQNVFRELNQAANEKGDSE